MLGGAAAPVLAALGGHHLKLQLEREIDARLGLRIFLLHLFHGRFVEAGHDLLGRQALPEIHGELLQLFVMFAQPQRRLLELRHLHELFAHPDEFLGVRAFGFRHGAEQGEVDRIGQERYYVFTNVVRLVERPRVEELVGMQADGDAVQVLPVVQIQRLAVFGGHVGQRLFEGVAGKRQQLRHKAVHLAVVQLGSGKERLVFRRQRESVLRVVGLLRRGEMVLLDQVVFMQPGDHAQLLQRHLAEGFAGILVVVQDVQLRDVAVNKLEGGKQRAAAVAEQIRADADRAAGHRLDEFLLQLLVVHRLQEGILEILFGEVHMVRMLRHQAVRRGIGHEADQRLVPVGVRIPFGASAARDMHQPVVCLVHRVHPHAEDDVDDRIGFGIAFLLLVVGELVQLIRHLPGVHAADGLVDEIGHLLRILCQALHGVAEVRNGQDLLGLLGQDRVRRHVLRVGAGGVQDQVEEGGDLLL